MTFLWQEYRSSKNYKVQTSDYSIAKKLKRRKKFHISAFAINYPLWIFSCYFTRPDIAKKVLESITRKKSKIDSEGLFIYE